MAKSNEPLASLVYEIFSIQFFPLTQIKSSFDHIKPLENTSDDKDNRRKNKL